MSSHFRLADLFKLGKRTRAPIIVIGGHTDAQWEPITTTPQPATVGLAPQPRQGQWRVHGQPARYQPTVADVVQRLNLLSQKDRSWLSANAERYKRHLAQ
jgi:hypothetical protein